MTRINLQFYGCLLDEISEEINRGNEKHGHGELATKIQVVSILCEELGEFAQAVMQGRKDDARRELIQVCAVALNHLTGTGPHFSNKK
jgi:NTP pyrophosphatase (non-canonical NTP hydrolase)